jgi:hypothetical protein
VDRIRGPTVRQPSECGPAQNEKGGEWGVLVAAWSGSGAKLTGSFNSDYSAA